MDAAARGRRRRRSTAARSLHRHGATPRAHVEAERWHRRSLNLARRAVHPGEPLSGCGGRSSLPRNMVQRALLFTDLVDSTALVERVGDAGAAALFSTHDRRARALVASHRGQEIRPPDGFFLLFDEAIDAARYALAYHRALADLALSARVGIHVGQVILRANMPEEIARGAKPLEVE